MHRSCWSGQTRLPPLEPPWPEGSAKAASLRNGIPEVGVRKRLYGSEVPTRVQIFGSPGARDSRYRLPDSLFGSELRRALQRERCFPLFVSALPCRDLRNLGEVLALMRMAYRHRQSDG